MALLDGHFDAALDLARTSTRMAAEMGMLYVQELSLTLTAHVLAHLARFEEALAAAAEARAFVAGSVIGNMGTELLFVEAWIASRRGETDRALHLTRSAFETSKRTGYAYWFRFLPDVLPHACELALSAGIEPAYVTSVVRRYGVQPLHPHLKDWPWPLRVSALGKFAVAKAGVELDASRAGTRKPMELLKAIIALGVDSVPAVALVDALWPDADGDAGHKALDTTVHRLRKQLGDDRAVVVKAGKLGIDSNTCFVDVSAFERIVQEASGCSDRHRAHQLSAGLQAHYCGPLFGAEPLEPWMRGPRQRLGARFLACAATLGAVLEQHGDTDSAVELYLHAIDVDPKAEPMYRRLMDCYRKRERLADAADAYRRCCAALQAETAAKPSAETEALYRAIVASPRI